VPKTGGVVGLPPCKDFVDVLANAERVIENLSEYDRPDQEGHITQTGNGVSETAHSGIVAAGLDPVSSLSFALALLAASYTRRASRAA
jgi:hypothetical protein